MECISPPVDAAFEETPSEDAGESRPASQPRSHRPNRAGHEAPETSTEIRIRAISTPEIRLKLIWFPLVCCGKSLVQRNSAGSLSVEPGANRL
jgi:hypothetical protein